MVIVKRGDDVDIIQDENPPQLHEDIRDWTRDMDWAEISRECYDNIPQLFDDRHYPG